MITFNDREFQRVLMAKGVIDDLQNLRIEQGLKENPGSDFVSMLMRIALLPEEKLCEEIAEFVGGQFIRATHMVRISHDVYSIDIDAAIKYRILPMMYRDELGEDLLFYVLINPFCTETIKLLNDWSMGKEFVIGVVSESLFRRIVDTNSQLLSSVKAGLIESSGSSGDEIRILLERIIQDAIVARASDIRIYRFDNDGIVKFRIDGELEEHLRFSSDVLSRLTLMIESDDLTEVSDTNRDALRTGIMRIKIDGKGYELRVNFIPVKGGIDVNLRFLYSENFDLSVLGASDERISYFLNLSARDYGLVLFTGPTGSGKSTTMYSLLREINAENTVCTVEDPVEHILAGVVQVNVSKTTTYVDAIMSFLRHDPDVIVVGEIRSEAVAKAAIMAADTGHLVFSTLHTKTADGAISRLRGLGVSNTEICDNLIAVIAQILVKRVCKQCAIEVTLHRDVLFKELGLKESNLYDLNIGEEVTVLREQGCSECKGRGYSGRCLVSEVLEVDEDVRMLIMDDRNSYEIYTASYGRQLHAFDAELVSALCNKTISLEEASRIFRRIAR